MEPDFTKGLLTTVVVDATTKDVLMVAWMNEASYRLTKQTGRPGFGHAHARNSGTRGRLLATPRSSRKCGWTATKIPSWSKWTRPARLATPGHGLVFSTRCRERKIKMQDLESLYQMVAARKANPKEGSYTDYLFTKGLDKILKKVGEETTEVIVAAKNEGTAELQYETVDLLYHLMVLLVEQGLTYDDIKEELGKREGLMSDFKDRPEIKDL